MSRIALIYAFAAISLHSFSQFPIWASKVYSKSAIDSFYATDTGISGPGKPVIWDGFGGSAGSIAQKVTEDNRRKLASGSVAKSDLIPNIMPIWDFHMRDAVIIVGGDGN